MGFSFGRFVRGGLCWTGAYLGTPDFVLQRIFMLNYFQIQIRLTMDILFMDCRIIIWTYNRFIFYDTYEYQNLLPDSLSSLWYVFDNNYENL